MVLKAWLLRQLMVVWRKEWRREIEEMMTLSLMAACCERDGWGRLGSFSESLLLINWWSTSTALSGADANKSEACESNISQECSGLDKKPHRRLTSWFDYFLMALTPHSSGFCSPCSALVWSFSFSFLFFVCFVSCFASWSEWTDCSERNCSCPQINDLCVIVVCFICMCVWSMWIWCIVSCDDCYWMRKVFLISFEI